MRQEKCKGGGALFSFELRVLGVELMRAVEETPSVLDNGYSHLNCERSG